MELHKIRSGTEQSLFNKEYNIGVGISLGTKWFSPENIVGLIEWSLKYTKDFVVVYIADSIHAINLQVRNDRTPEKALEIAMGMGDAILEKIKTQAQSKFTPEQLAKIHYARWDELLTPEFKRKLAYLQNKYKTDENFKAAILKNIDEFLKKETRVFSENDRVRLGEYLISELPEHLCRVPTGGLVYDAFVYPYDSAFPEFVEKVQKGVLFPEIKKTVMDSEPKVFLVAR